MPPECCDTLEQAIDVQFELLMAQNNVLRGQQAKRSAPLPAPRAAVHASPPGLTQDSENRGRSEISLRPLSSLCELLFKIRDVKLALGNPLLQCLILCQRLVQSCLQEDRQITSLLVHDERRTVQTQGGNVKTPCCSEPL